MTSPVIIGHVKATETDAQARARLAQEVGRLTAELTKARNALDRAQNGCWDEAKRFGGSPIVITVRGENVPVAIVTDEEYPKEWFIAAIWTGHSWLNLDLMELDERWMAEAIKAVETELRNQEP